MPDSSDDLAKIFMRTGDLINPPHLGVIGDSHALFFAGVEKMEETHALVKSAHPFIRVYYVGPGLAGSLIKPHSRNRTREKIAMALADLAPFNLRHIVFVFGEVDCRYHIRQRAISLGNDTTRGWQLSAKMTALRYMTFLHQVQQQGVAPVIFAPPPSTPHPADAHQWLTIGTTQERNRLTRDFIYALQDEAARFSIPVISLFEELVDKDLNTLPAFSEDEVHIAQAHWPLWVEKAKALGIAT
jgi:hypothetical protein